MAKFAWDASALVPDVVTLPFPKTAKAGSETEDVMFVEFSRIKNEQFVAECTDTKVGAEVDEPVEEPDPDHEGQTRTVTKKRYKANPFKDVTAQQAAIVNKWLAEATQRGDTPKDVKYFEKLGEIIGSWAFGHLVEMLFEINHVHDIMASSGNYLLLPQILEVNRQAAAGAKAE